MDGVWWLASNSGGSCLKLLSAYTEHEYCVQIQSIQIFLIHRGNMYNVLCSIVCWRKLLSGYIENEYCEQIQNIQILSARTLRKRGVPLLASSLASNSGVSCHKLLSGYIVQRIHQLNRLDQHSHGAFIKWLHISSRAHIIALLVS